MERKPLAILTCIYDKPLPVNRIGPDLEEDKLYPLKDIFVCKCGEEHYNVGLKLNVNFVECYKCRETLPNGTHWCHSSRFKVRSVCEKNK